MNCHIYHSVFNVVELTALLGYHIRSVCVFMKAFGDDLLFKSFIFEFQDDIQYACCTEARR